MTAAAREETPTMASMVAQYVNGAQEAALVGWDAGVITEVRRDPTHPANGPDAIRAGRNSVLVPRQAVIDWWRDHPRPSRSEARRVHPAAPADWPEDRRTWLALLAHGRGEPGAYTALRPRLIRLGYLDEDGDLTDQGHAATATARQEQQQ